MTDVHRGVCVVPLPQAIRPHDALAMCRNEPYAALLESSGPPSKLGRYSFLCLDPMLVFRSKRNACYVGPPGQLERIDRDPLKELASLLGEYAGSVSGWTPDLPPFLGGAVGYFGYETLYLIEKVPDRGRDDFPVVPDIYFTFYRTVLATDRVAQRSWLASNGFGATLEEATSRAASTVAEALATLRGVPHVASSDGDPKLMERRDKILASRRLSTQDLADGGFRVVVEAEKYLDIVRKAKDHIFAGDIFEVCTSQRIDTTYQGTGEHLYRVLRSVNQAPFAAYLRFPELEVMSSSPERFMSLDRERWAETRPIKGTRPRGVTPEQDQALFHDLATCEKDNAENIMIVDLARNDLGRVCEFGTVSVPELRVIESYPFTHQLVSTVRARVRRDVDAIDVIRAAFPGGSMTGAPKVESMRIIDALEPVKRGVFSGSIGYIDFDGSFDLNIVIRTFVKVGNSLTFHVGGAIVADSDPAEEYQETLDKAHGLVTALELARELSGDSDGSSL